MGKAYVERDLSDIFQRMQYDRMGEADSQTASGLVSKAEELIKDTDVKGSSIKTGDRRYVYDDFSISRLARRTPDVKYDVLSEGKTATVDVYVAETMPSLRRRLAFGIFASKTLIFTLEKSSPVPFSSSEPAKVRDYKGVLLNPNELLVVDRILDNLREQILMNNTTATRGSAHDTPYFAQKPS